MDWARIAASPWERQRAFPGDAFVDESLATWTHGVTIDAPQRDVWPWLLQMGAGRAGWYSWDFVDNGGRHSAEAIVPGLQRIGLGDVLPAGPGVTSAFQVVRLEPERDLVLGVPFDGGGPSATWEFLLDPAPGGRTRLLVRTRVGPRGWMAPLAPATPSALRVSRVLARLPRGPILAVARAGHRVMQARQLRSIRRRAEGRRGSISRLLRAENGMNIVGQGGRILLLTAPVLAAAVAIRGLAPGLVRLPIAQGFLTPIGAVLFLAGVALWAAAVAQLVAGFAQGRLVTTGAYGICRNPIYASVSLLALPGLSLLLGTWAYLVPAAALWLGVRLFIPAEERDLRRVFGEEYVRYTERVHRFLPWVRPGPGDR